ncbi:Hypothetical protein CINCED_3A011773 [Cinara cedri]|uniref:Uncharacterized protein n=1 Tax=Cinara cedri TaxID=506608 RepID=A0A5E4MN95_9HEMI|nr:Hypothetical protein CINCED_3A011773 [Cinara cedri]
MDFSNQFRLDNFEDRYQRRITRLDKKNKYELNKKYDRINKKLTRDMGIEIEKQHLSKKINEKEKPISDHNIEPVVEENRIRYPVEEEHEFGQDSDKHVNLFQNLLQGRAYQTMMIMAKIRYEPLLQPFLYPEGTLVEHSSTIAENNDKQETITKDHILENSTRRYVSRFLDTISKEAIIKHDDEENKRLIKLGELTRVMREAAEGNRRHKEITGRKEQDEILKQVIKIHQDISDLFSEQFMEEAIDQCAKEEGLKLIQIVTSRRSIFKAAFCHNNNKNFEPELVHNFIIPETYKIIHRQHTN